MKCFPRRDEIPFLPFSVERKKASRHLLRLLFPLFHVNGYSNYHAKYFFILLKKSHKKIIFSLLYCHEINEEQGEPSKSPFIFPLHEFFRPGKSMTRGQKCTGTSGTAGIRRCRKIRANFHLKVFMSMTCGFRPRSGKLHPRPWLPPGCSGRYYFFTE